MEDPLLKALTDTAKEIDPLADPRWEALAEGTLSAEDEAALAALARTSERHRALYEAFRPLDEAARARIAASLVAASPPPARVVPLRRRWTWALAAAAALAGGVWLAAGRPHEKITDFDVQTQGINGSGHTKHDPRLCALRALGAEIGLRRRRDYG